MLSLLAKYEQLAALSWTLDDPVSALLYQVHHHVPIVDLTHRARIWALERGFAEHLRHRRMQVHQLSQVLLA